MVTHWKKDEKRKGDGEWRNWVVGYEDPGVSLGLFPDGSGGDSDNNDIDRLG